MKNAVLVQNLTPEDIKTIISDAIERKLNELISTRAEPDEYMTRQEAANLLRISLTTLHDYTKRGILVGHTIGSRILYQRDQIKNSINKIEGIKYKRA